MEIGDVVAGGRAAAITSKGIERQAFVSILSFAITSGDDSYVSGQGSR